jgi:hypothetical protein
MDKVHALLDAANNIKNGTKAEQLIASIHAQGVIVFCFVICSFFVASTENAGFNCVLTGFLNAGYCAGAYHVVKNSKAPIAVCFVCIKNIK